MSGDRVRTSPQFKARIADTVALQITREFFRQVEHDRPVLGFRRCQCDNPTAYQLRPAAGIRQIEATVGELLGGEECGIHHGWSPQSSPANEPAEKFGRSVANLREPCHAPSLRRVPLDLIPVCVRVYDPDAWSVGALVVSGNLGKDHQARNRFSDPGLNAVFIHGAGDSRDDGIVPVHCCNLIGE